MLRRVDSETRVWQEASLEAGATLETVGSENLALSCGVKAGIGDSEVERLEFGDRWATGAREEGEGGVRPVQGDDLVDMRGQGRKGRAGESSRAVEDPSESLPPLHPTS